jgi:hypothetical protein
VHNQKMNTYTLSFTMRGLNRGSKGCIPWIQLTTVQYFGDNF